MKTSSLLFLVVALSAVTLFGACNAAPKKFIDKYDNRQDGKLNVESKLSNILILIAPSSLNTGNLDVAELVQNGILAQTIGLRNVIPRIAEHPENEEINEKPEDFIDSRVDDEESTSKKVEKPEANSKLISTVKRDFSEDVESTDSQSNKENKKELKIQENRQVEAEEAIEKSKKSARSLKKVTSELSVSKLPPIEKQLPLENKIVGNKEREDSVGQADREPQELKLIGGGIENCGPDRFRDRFGICQARVEKQ